jgi:hypothetical protein
MESAELARHLKDHHGIDPLSMTLADKPYQRHQRMGARSDFVTIHMGDHERRQRELDHDHSAEEKAEW